MVVVEVASSDPAVAEFIDLPPRLYEGNPSYAPPLRFDRAMLLHPRKSAFWKEAPVRYWLARKDGRPAGRISAQLPPVLPVGMPARTGMFGCLDAIDDPAVVGALVEAARGWLREHGCEAMVGPCSLDMNDEPGLLVEGADEPPMTLYPWSPPFLGPALEALGFERLRDLHSWRLDGDAASALPEGRRLAERIPGLTVRGADRRAFGRDIAILCDVYNDGWRDNWGFAPLTPADLEGLDQLIRWFVPEQAFRIVELDGEPVAVMLLVPNFFEITRGLAPRPGLLGWPRLLWRAARHRFRSGRIIVTGVSRRLRHTPQGAAIAALLVDELVASQAALGGEWVEAGWVLENNHALVRILERFRFRRNRTFRIYRQPIAPCATAQTGVN